MEGNQKTKAARVSIFSNSLLIVMKLAVGILMQSVSVISEAIHSAIDLIAAIIAYFSVKEAGKPADDEHRYGHGKIENLSGSIEAALIFLAAIMIIYEAVKKLQEHNFAIEAVGAGAAVMGISALVNWFVSRYLMKIAKKTDSIALEADALHLRTDVVTSAGVFAGLLAIKITGIKILDPIIAMAVALLIIKAAFDLTKEAVLNILDTKLPENEEKVILEVLDEYAGEYVEFHKLRTRKSGAERMIDLHLVVPKELSVEISHTISHEISQKIEEKLPNCNILMHIEPCESDCPNCKNHCLDS